MIPTIQKPEIHEKRWGREEWICNSDYCGKILQFNKIGAKFSLHLHLKKDEWFYFLNNFTLRLLDTEDATIHELNIKTGETIHLKPGVPHQLIALEENSRIIEFSSHHEDSDSYRIEKGDSQV